MPKLEQEYRIVRTPKGPERHLVTFRDGKPVSSENVSNKPAPKDWKRYKRDTVGGSIGIEQIGE